MAAYATWEDRLAGREAAFFIDNDGDMAAIIKGSSEHPTSMLLVRWVWQLAAAYHTNTWCARVPSPSNPADGPSQLCFRDAQQRWGAVRVHPEILSPLTGKQGS